REKRITRKPMVAFQNPITDQGSVQAKKKSSSASSAPNPPADNASAATPTSAAMVMLTSVAKRTRRPVILLLKPGVRETSEIAASLTLNNSSPLTLPQDIAERRSQSPMRGSRRRQGEGGIERRN